MQALANNYIAEWILVRKIFLSEDQGWKTSLSIISY